MLRGRYSVRGTVVWGTVVAVKCCPAVAVVEVCGGGAVGCGVIMELKMELIFSCVY